MEGVIIGLLVVMIVILVLIVLGAIVFKILRGMSQPPITNTRGDGNRPNSVTNTSVVADDDRDSKISNSKRKGLS